MEANEKKEMEQEYAANDRGLISKGLRAIGLRYTLLGMVVMGLQVSASVVLKIVNPRFMDDHYAMISFILIIVTMDMIGFPLIYSLCKKLDREQLPTSKLGVWQFLQGIFICAGISVVGAIIGAVMNALCTIPFGVDSNSTGLVWMMLNSNFFMRVLTVGILAPIFEELIFRKILIDHLAKYGKVLAFLASGLIFGIFHGNFSQCFFAAGLGCFFAYIYLKTGSIRYSIGYHMIINCSTSIITLELVKKYLSVATVENLSALSRGNEKAIAALLPAMILYLSWLGFLLLCGLVGIIFICVKFAKGQFRVNDFPGAMSKGESLKALLTNPGMLTFYAFGLIMFLYSYLVPIVRMRLHI